MLIDDTSKKWRHFCVGGAESCLPIQMKTLGPGYENTKVTEQHVIMIPARQVNCQP